MTVNNIINTPIPFAIVKGGTGVTSVTIAPTASAWAGWDANKNFSGNSIIPGYTTTATAAATTTLTVGSTYQQYFTGTTTQTVLMPVTSTLVLGQPYYIVNNSTGNVTVQSSGANAIQVMAPGTNATLTCILTSGTTAASWNCEYSANNAAITGISTQTFFTTGTYTPTPGMIYCIVELVSGGGGGGGVTASAGGTGSAAGGGGGGGYARGLFTAATIGASQSVTIGAGGAGGSGVGAATGSVGTSTIFGAGVLLTSNGGSGGAGQTASAGYNASLGGQGGGGGAGYINAPGGAGMTGISISSGGQPIPAMGGYSQFGTPNQGQVNTAPSTGLGKGSGGNGACNVGGPGAINGANGADGILIVTEFLSV